MIKREVFQDKHHPLDGFLPGPGVCVVWVVQSTI